MKLAINNSYEKIKYFFTTHWWGYRGNIDVIIHTETSKEIRLNLSIKDAEKLRNELTQQINTMNLQNFN